MRRSVFALGLLLSVVFVSGCGSGGVGGGGDMPAAGMERCEMCGKDVAAGELQMKKDSKVCSECVDKV